MNKIKRSWLLALVLSLVLAPTAGHAGCIVLSGGQVLSVGTNALCGVGAPFDYYISPTGDDNNAGTLGSPWSISALNSKQSTYAGKRVGLLPGTYTQGTVGGVHTTIDALQNAAGSSAVGIVVNGGTTTPTFLGSSDASGFYSPRTAILAPVTRPNSSYGMIGQGYQQATNKGNVTIDGIVIHNGWENGFMFYPQLQSGGASGYPWTGSTLNQNIRVQNSEVYDIQGDCNSNMGGIFLEQTIGAYIGNNVIHDIGGTGNQANCNAVHGFSNYSATYELNTIYNVPVGIHNKSQGNGNSNHTIRYNYIELSGTAATSEALSDGVASVAGDIETVHHNITYAVTGWLGATLDTANGGGALIYNNTFIQGGTGGAFSVNLYASAGPITAYNNLVVSQGHVTNGIVTLYPPAYSLGSYNTYDDSSHAPTWAGTSTNAPGPTITQYSPLSAWQTAVSTETTSQVATPTFAGSIGTGTLTATNYQLTGSVGVGTGHVGGTSGGSAVNRGAWDGVVTQIGANFSGTAFSGLAVTTSSLTNATVGSAFSQTMAATGGTPPYAWSIASQNPNTQLWRYMTRAGVMYGTPQLDESGPVTVLVTDSVGNTATATLTHTITNSGSFAIVSPTSLPNATVNGGYFYQLIYSGGTAPYQNCSISGTTGTNTWYVTNDCWIYGVPTTSETDTVTVVSGDLTDTLVTQTETIVVNSTITLSGIDSTLAAIKIPDGRQGTKYTHQLRPANGGTGSGQTFSVSSGAFPAGISMSSSGLITGTPTYSGNALVSVQVTDSGSNTTTAYPIQWNIPRRETGSKPGGNTASGFYVSRAGDLCDTNGNVFVMRGINRDHYDQAFSAYNTSGTNAVRYTLYLTQFRGSSPSGSKTAATYFGDADTQHVANKQFPIVAGFYVPGGTTAISGTNTATTPATSAAWMIDNLASWVSSGMQNNAAFNIANEWGPSNSTNWRDAYLYVAEPIASISGTTITLASSVTGATNPFAAAVNGGWMTIAGNSGNATGAFAVSAVGGSSGAWTVTVAGASAGTGGTLYGGAIGILRGGGFTDPIVIDSGGFGQDLADFTTYGVTVAQSDPMANTLLSYHAYGQTTNLQGAISTVSSGSNAVLTFTWAGATHPFTWPGYSPTFLTVRGTGVTVAGVTGASGINGTHLSLTNQSTSAPWTLTSTFTAGSSGSGGIATDYAHANNIASVLAAFKASGVGILFGEFGPGQGTGPSPSLTSIQQISTAVEQNEVSRLYWAMDDGSAPFGATISAGTYTVPTDLTRSGIDAILNPRYGITATAQPASSY